jgi:DNA invertase Pin-like site-specific DNA recombinase
VSHHHHLENGRVLLDPPRFEREAAQDALKAAGCEKIFMEQMSGAVTDRPALREALGYARGCDTLIVCKLDCLARSMKQLIETIERLRLGHIGFRSLTEAIDTTTAQGVLVFHTRLARELASPL